VPLTERVEFKTVLQKGNRVQVPKLIRWKYKLESTQALKVSVAMVGKLGSWESFLGRVDKSGRTTFSRLMQLQLLRGAPRARSLVGDVVLVRLEPA